jgi:hypothetical protein
MVAVSLKRFEELLKLLGGGNVAGVVAMTSALKTFGDRSDLTALIKNAAVVYSIGVLFFAVTLLIVVVARMSRMSDDPEVLSEFDKYRLSRSNTVWPVAAIVIGTLSCTVALFGGLILSFISILKA